MVIKKLSYKFNEQDAEYTDIPIASESGSYIEKSKPTDNGTLYTTDITAYVPNITTDNDLLINKLTNRNAIYRVEDSYGNVHIVGDNIARCSFASDKLNDGKPGAKYGYNIKISLTYSKRAVLVVL